MCACLDAFENDLLEIAAGDALIIEEHIEAVVSQMLINCERPGHVGVPVANEHRLFNTCHLGFDSDEA